MQRPLPGSANRSGSRSTVADRCVAAHRATKGRWPGQNFHHSAVTMPRSAAEFTPRVASTPPICRDSESVTS